jgi:hypothetical protein
LSAYAAEQAAIANRYTAEAESLAAAYAQQQARKAAAAARAAARALKRAAAARAARAVTKAAKTVARVAVTVGKVAYKLSGAQAIVSCVTNPNVTDCVEAGIAIVADASIIATGEADIGVVGAEAAVEDVAVDGLADAGEEGASAAEQTAEEVTEQGGKSGSDKLKNAAIQMSIGGVTGAAGNVSSAAEEGRSGRQILEAGVVGLVTGALSDVPFARTIATVGIGGVTGAANGYPTQGIANHNWSNPDLAGVGVDALLGGGDNLVGAGIQHWGGEARNGQTWGNLTSGVLSVAATGSCGMLDTLGASSC